MAEERQSGDGKAGRANGRGAAGPGEGAGRSGGRYNGTTHRILVAARAHHRREDGAGARAKALDKVVGELELAG